MELPSEEGVLWKSESESAGVCTLYPLAVAKEILIFVQSGEHFYYPSDTSKVFGTLKSTQNSCRRFSGGKPCPAAEPSAWSC